MKFSESWLREWVNPALSRDELSEQITMLGLEVDGIEPVAGEFTGVVVGKVVACKQHPNADKLRVTKVDVGQDELLDIVCGAPNCREGLLVACATVGAVLPGNFKIKAAKLRGEPSHGMLCSYSELGISEDHDGIIELPADAPIGTDIRKYLNLDDATIEISVTPNRADCLGIAGVARDVALANELPLTRPNSVKAPVTINDTIDITVEAKEACPRYLSRIVKGVNVNAKTPLWMREKLRRCGIRSIDPVVDVTNYVLLELGQPMHAFDLAKLNGGIVVRMAKAGEKLTLLDGNEVEIKPETLVIADHAKALALGGIFGGEESGVSAQTQDILFECAYFDPNAITGRARLYGLHTDASHRYERGVDPELQMLAIERATELLTAICGGEVGPIVDATSEAYLPKRATIQLRRTKLDKLLGHPIEDAKVTDILERLGCQVSFADNVWTAVAPSWRFDMEIEEDLIEEVARIYGYNNIPDAQLYTHLIMPVHPEHKLALDRLKLLLADRGYQEAITYSFVDPKQQKWVHPGKEALVLPNPISADMSAMRLSLMTGLLTTVAYNQNRQQHRVRLFESGLCFIPDESAEFGIRQELRLGGVITGLLNDEHWDMPRKQVDFFDMKGDLEALLAQTDVLDKLEFRRSNNEALHPGQSADIYLDNELMGYIGVIHPTLEKLFDLNGRTVIFELLWDKISGRKVPQANDISRFPANRRDIAVIVAEDVAAGDVLNAIRNIGENHIVGVNLFDVYRGKGVEDGFKSLAISLILQDNSRTLEEEEIATTVAKCVDVLKQRFQASLRD